MVMEPFAPASEALASVLPYVAGHLFLAPFEPDTFDEEYLDMLGDTGPVEATQRAFGALEAANFIPDEQDFN